MRPFSLHSAQEIVSSLRNIIAEFCCPRPKVCVGRLEPCPILIPSRIQNLNRSLLQLLDLSRIRENTAVNVVECLDESWVWLVLE